MPQFLCYLLQQMGYVVICLPNLFASVLEFKCGISLSSLFSTDAPDLPCEPPCSSLQQFPSTYFSTTSLESGTYPTGPPPFPPYLQPLYLLSSHCYHIPSLQLCNFLALIPDDSKSALGPSRTKYAPFGPETNNPPTSPGLYVLCTG